MFLAKDARDDFAVARHAVQDLAPDAIHQPDDGEEDAGEKGWVHGAGFHVSGSSERMKCQPP
jgi:hypothetical protein